MRALTTYDFEYTPHSKVFDAEASVIGHPGSEFLLTSQWTGEQVHFVLQGECRDEDNDLLYWRYRPVETDMSALSVVIWND